MHVRIGVLDTVINTWTKSVDRVATMLSQSYIYKCIRQVCARVYNVSAVSCSGVITGRYKCIRHVYTFARIVQ